jgi:hypothetical protein
MRAYGTEDVFCTKTANGISPLLAQLLSGLFNFELVSGNRKEEARSLEKAEELGVRKEREERAKVEEAAAPLRHTAVPRLTPAGSDLPAGYDEGTVRLAAAAGQDLAKLAGNAFTSFLGGGSGLKTNLALGATAIGGTLLANKGIQAVKNKMEAPRTPVEWGAGHHGFQIPYGVNQYGQPALGTPLG